MSLSKAAKALIIGVLGVLGALAGLSGCAAPVAPLLPVALPAVIAGAGGGISYTLTSIAYRTMTNPVEEVERATLKAAMMMSLRVDKVEHGEYNVEITATTRAHDISITLERLTPTLTRLSVNARRGLLFKDKTTAFEIIYNTEVALAGLEAERTGRPVEGLPVREGKKPGA